MAQSSARGMMTTGQIDTCIAGLMYECWDIVLVFLLLLSILLNDNKIVKDIAWLENEDGQLVHQSIV